VRKDPSLGAARRFTRARPVIKECLSQENNVHKRNKDAPREESTMLEISEPTSGSLTDATTHDVLLDGKQIGYIIVSYLGKSELKTFRKYAKRKLIAGQAYSVHVFIDAVKGASNAKSLGKQGLHEIVVTLLKQFKGLEERDIYVLEVGTSGKTIVGRGTEL
jgi:hypothetical protein